MSASFRETRRRAIGTCFGGTWERFRFLLFIRIFIDIHKSFRTMEQTFDSIYNELQGLKGLSIEKALSILKNKFGAKYSTGPTIADKEDGTTWSVYEFYIDHVGLFYIEFIEETGEVSDVDVRKDFHGKSIDDLSWEERLFENTKKKKVISLNEGQVKKLIHNAVMGVISEMYDFSSSKPQFDINSDEWNQNYDGMQKDARSKKADKDNAMMDLQIKHHLGKKGKDGFEGDLPKHGKQYGKDAAMSPATIESRVISALNDGKSPEEIMNLKPFSPEETEYIKDDCLDWLEPVGTIDKAGKIVFYDTRKDKFVSYDDDRAY